MSKLLITLVGPTAVGKTSLSLYLAKELQAAILSADSRQFYQDLNIGTAKPTKEEQAQAPHYFIDSLAPTQTYNAAQYQREAEVLMQELFDIHDVLIMVGGSTLYMDAVWYQMDAIPEVPSAIREQLQDQWKQVGLAPLIEELAAVDPSTYEVIDRQNPARVIRALEVYRASGIPISTFRKGKKPRKTAYKVLKIGLYDDREALYERINQRVWDMIENGLVEEVKGLLAKGYSPTLQSLNTIGYQEIIPYLQGQYDLDEAIRLVQRNSRRYAKRQLTYYRRYEDITWFKAGDREGVSKWVLPQL
ncbi:MAG: tRNA (adenosine(37)-N6)-dimethylallyltransferase MiaA [Bacteroidota bacterium]